MSVTASVVSAIVSSVINAIADAPPSPAQNPAFATMGRNFPVEARKGELYPPIQQKVTINGQTLYAAPGLQVRNQQNLIVMPGTLQGTLPVRYQLDQMGNVWRIWILSAAEQAAPDKIK